MKLLFNLWVLIFPSVALPSKIIIHFPSEKFRPMAQEVMKLFNESYQIPSQLIQLQQNEDCNVTDKRFLELCINEKYELLRVENERQEEITKSLLIFSKPVEVSNDY